MTNPTQTTLELTILRHWIAGKPHDGQVERWGDVYDPATGAIFYLCSQSGSPVSACSMSIGPSPKANR